MASNIERPVQQNCASLEWDDKGQPLSKEFDDVYFSKNNGLAETRYVFLDGNKLSERWQKTDSEYFTIAETGFGTGLNFLASWQLWRQSKLSNNATLHYISVEKFPLKIKDLKKALALWPELAELSKALIEHYPHLPARDFRRLVFDEGNVILTLIFDEATDGLNQILAIDQAGEKVASQNPPASIGVNFQHVDAWFLDGFSPAKNPQMWRDELFVAMAKLSKPNTSLATFTVAGHVRRGLQQAGFSLAKRKGFANKREMLCGHLEKNITFIQSQRNKIQASWHLQANAPSHDKKDPIAIIGAGLAGCHAAANLAQHGYKVKIFDKGDIANAASGNPQGIVYSKLSGAEDVLARLSMACLHYANQFYQRKLHYQNFGQQCGVFYAAKNKQQQKSFQQIALNYGVSENFIHWFDKHEQSSITGLPTSDSDYGGIYLPESGWLNPQLVCKDLLAHPNIEISTNTKIDYIEQRDSQWFLHISNDITDKLQTFKSVIITSGYECKQFSQSAHLPLKAIRGQVSYVKATPNSNKLKVVMCGESYIAPSINNEHCIGASFNLHNHDTSLSNEDHQNNLDNAELLATDLQGLSAFDGRVSFRATTPDYLPIVGPIADPNSFATTFAKYRSNLKAPIDSPAHYQPGLYALTGLGSRGLAYAPLAAELLACMISGETLPLPRDLVLHLHPSRFLVRDLSRRRI